MAALSTLKICSWFRAVVNKVSLLKYLPCDWFVWFVEWLVMCIVLTCFWVTYYSYVLRVSVSDIDLFIFVFFFICKSAAVLLACVTLTLCAGCAELAQEIPGFPWDGVCVCVWSPSVPRWKVELKFLVMIDYLLYWLVVMFHEQMNSLKQVFSKHFFIENESVLMYMMTSAEWSGCFMMSWWWW